MATQFGGVLNLLDLNEVLCFFEGFYIRYKCVPGIISLLSGAHYNDLSYLNCLCEGTRNTTGGPEARFHALRRTIQGGTQYTLLKNPAGLAVAGMTDYCSALYRAFFKSAANNKRVKLAAAVSKSDTSRNNLAVPPSVNPVPPSVNPFTQTPSLTTEHPCAAVVIHLRKLLPPVGPFHHKRGAQPTNYDLQLTHSFSYSVPPSQDFIDRAAQLCARVSPATLSPIHPGRGALFRTPSAAIEDKEGTLASTRSAGLVYAMATAMNAAGVQEAVSPLVRATRRTPLCANCGGAHQTTYSKCPARRGDT